MKLSSNTKIKKSIINDPLGKAKDVKEPYIDGHEVVGK
jgi:hypothetical protein